MRALSMHRYMNTVRTVESFWETARGRNARIGASNFPTKKTVFYKGVSPLVEVTEHESLCLRGGTFWGEYRTNSWSNAVKHEPNQRSFAPRRT